MKRQGTNRLPQAGHIPRALNVIGLAVTLGTLAALLLPACGQGSSDDTSTNIESVRQAEGTPSPVACDQTSDTMPVFAAKCAAAMGIAEIPGFDCNGPNSVEVPETQPNGTTANHLCDRPNVLNGVCDPGSRFQVVVDQTNSRNEHISIVAHCRKKGVTDPNQFVDVAMIAYNYKTGDTCFFQDAAPSSPNPAIAPSPAHDLTTSPYWQSPASVAGAPCVRCHDNGPFIRTPYFGQLMGTPAKTQEIQPILDAQKYAKSRVPQAIVPGSRDRDWNSTQPYRFVGGDFQGWKAFALSERSTGANNGCLQCHRMGISAIDTGTTRTWSAGIGSAQVFGLLATGNGVNAQKHKNPHIHPKDDNGNPISATYTSPI